MNGIHQVLLASLLSVPPPPAAMIHGPYRNVALFEPGPARCSGGIEIPLRIEEPVPVAATLFQEGLAGGFQPSPIRLRFRIDADGRPLSIREESREGFESWLDGSDVAPALASWRFRPGVERSDCSIIFSVRPFAPESLPEREKARYIATPEGGGTLYQEGSVAAEAFAGLVPPDSTCADQPRVGVRTWTYVDPADVSSPPGSHSFAQIVYDVSDSGWAANVRVVRSSGNKDFDREAAEAMSGSRFEGPVRKGCTYVAALGARRPMPAPPPPAITAFARETDACSTRANGWADIPALTFPEPFRRRAIEGWAVIRYDVAPWGSVGNMSIVAAEPAEAFGQEAMRILANARRNASRLGETGCLQTLIFDIPSAGGEDLASLD